MAGQAPLAGQSARRWRKDQLKKAEGVIKDV